MTLDEAIKAHEQKLYECRNILANWNEKYYLFSKEMYEEAEKSWLQSLEWLKELKEYKKSRVGCEYCKHNFREQHERPCSLCKRNFMDLFERKEDANGN